VVYGKYDTIQLDSSYKLQHGTHQLTSSVDLACSVRFHL